MKRLCQLARIALLSLPLAALSAQDAASSFTASGVPPAPVVSSLSASVLGDTIILTWTPAPDVTGTSEILRSESPITAATEATAELRGKVDHGVTEFRDASESGKTWWYAVVSTDSDGTRYNFFLPASNSLIMPVYTGAVAIPTKSTISGFTAKVRNDAVILGWSATLPGTNLVLYRSTSPFTSFSSLVSAVLVSAFADSGGSFTDYPVPGVPYYYALLDEDAVHAGIVAFEKGTNMNSVPVEVPAELSVIKRATVQPLRPMPLPFLNLAQGTEVPKTTFSPATEERIARLMGSAREPVRVHIPFIFRSDLESTTSGGDEYALRLIVTEGFGAGAYEATIARLDDFLSLRRSEQTAARAHFYRGEAYFFLGKHEEALLDFLLARDTYENQAGEWIQYALSALP